MLYSVLIVHWGWNHMGLLWFIVPPEQVVASTNTPVIKSEGEVLNIWCSPSSSNPKSNIKWSGSKGSVSKENIRTSMHSDDHHSWNVRSALQMKLSRKDNNRILTCSPVYRGRLLTNLTRDFIIMVNCEYSKIFNYECNNPWWMSFVYCPLSVRSTKGVDPCEQWWGGWGRPAGDQLYSYRRQPRCLPL